ncbi:hypothetical protein F4801DRAFT_21636 [Xylaria longipes]|nr:hypothetical protein F4801DRAFT_21636 [Xylaria longipes]
MSVSTSLRAAGYRNSPVMMHICLPYLPYLIDSVYYFPSHPGQISSPYDSDSCMNEYTLTLSASVGFVVSPSLLAISLRSRHPLKYS